MAVRMMRLQSAWVVCVLVGILAGCSGGAVVFEPTPLPPDYSPIEYTHPSGAFSVLVPPNWSLFVPEDIPIAHAAFSPPGSDSPQLFISVVNLGQQILPSAVGDLMLEYQTQVRPDAANYTESERVPYGDGSWQMTGLRQLTNGTTQPVNTFLETNGDLLGVVNVLLPQDAALRSQAQSIVNTYTLRADATLPVSELSALSAAAPVQLELVNVTTWTTASGVFYVTGEVANNGMRALTGIPVRAALLSDDEVVVADAADAVMGYVLQAGSFGPFSLRFGQGRPANASDYEVTIGGDTWQPDEAFPVVSADGLQWTDNTQYSPDGALFITGTITNIGTDAVRNLRAVATVFDSDGDVIAAAFSEADAAVLQPDAETNYTILITDRGGLPEQYIVDVQGIPCGERC